MNKILTIVLLTMCVSEALAQAHQSDSVRRADSLRRLEMELQWQVSRQRQLIYQQMYARNPKKAVDSAVAAQQVAQLPRGQARLQAYIENLRLDTLSTIDLSYAGLKTVPEWVQRAQSAQVLILDYNDIRKLPKWLADLPHLKRIYWRANSLEDRKWIGVPKMPRLEKLDLGNNTLTRVPWALRRIQHLEELVLDENLFDKVPLRRLAKVNDLRTLSMGKVPTLKIGEGKYEKLAQLQVFKANNCNLKEIHPDLYRLAGLNELQLQENDLQMLPDGISAMKGLTKLSLYKNQMSSLPADLFELSLVVIDLYYNQLEVLPEVVEQLQSLEVLFLAHNKLYSLPESIGGLHKLEELYLHHNRLSAIPASVAQLQNLKVIRVNDNYLMDFPVQVLGLAQLSDLDISGNQITTLPVAIGMLQNLELFTYHDNPIDFNAPVNRQLAPVVFQMQERGTICTPRVYMDEEEGAE